MPDPTAKYVVLRDPKTNEILIPRTTALDYEVVDEQPIPPYELNVDADTLQGHPASDYYTKDEVDELISKTNGYGYSVTVTDFAGNILANTPINFCTADTGHIITTVITDASGYAEYWGQYTKITVEYNGLYDTLQNGTSGTLVHKICYAVGNNIIWDDKDWFVCHYDSSNNRVYLIAKAIISMTKFGSNNTYAGSTLASVAANYQTNNMSAEALERCVNVTVNGVTAKVFVPSYEQFNGGFSWFNSSANRRAAYNSTVTAYWTSSAYDSSNVWYVTINGGLDDNPVGSYSNGFRPCVCVQL